MLRARLHKTAIALVIFALILACRDAHVAARQQTSRVFALIGIPSEIAPVEARLENPMPTRIQGIVFTLGTIGGKRVIAVRTAFGKVNAAMAATLLLDHFAPSAVVFTGTAGAVAEDLNPGDTVIATGVGYHDFGDFTAEGFVRSTPRNAVTGTLDPAFFPADPALLAAARRAAKTVKLSRGRESDPEPRIHEGVIVTGDAFVANPAQRAALRRDLNASAVEMEGAAVVQVCDRYGVPAIVIRSITDHADGDAKNSYPQYVRVASENAAGLALALIRELN